MILGDYLEKGILNHNVYNLILKDEQKLCKENIAKY